MRDGTRGKRPSKTATVKPHSARSLLSLLIRDVLFWYTVLGDDLFSLKETLYDASVITRSAIGWCWDLICEYIGVPVRTFPVI